MLCLFYKVMALVGLTVAMEDPTKVILSQCPNLQPFVNSPNANGSPLNVSVSFRFDRLIGIDEVAESLTVIGSLGLHWNVSCLQNLTNMGNWPDDNLAPLFNLKYKDFWLPSVGLRNSISGTLSDQYFDVDINLYPDGFMVVYFWGKYEVYCDLNFANFPFDTYVFINFFNFVNLFFFFSQNCGVELLSFRNHNPVLLEVKKDLPFSESEQLRSSNSVWEVDPINRDSIKYHRHRSFDALFFTLTMRRNFHYYLISITVPLWIMVILMCCSFFIPPQSSERANFSATIMLSIFVLQGAVLGSLPTTRQPVITAYSMLIQTAIAAISTCYSCLMCWLLKYKRQTMTKVTNFRQWKLYCIIDVVAFIITCLSFLLTNIITFGLIA